MEELQEAENTAKLAKYGTSADGFEPGHENIKPEYATEQLELQSDIYSYTFWKFVKDQNITLITELMIKCFLTIMV